MKRIVLVLVALAAAYVLIDRDDPDAAAGLRPPRSEWTTHTADDGTRGRAVRHVRTESIDRPAPGSSADDAIAAAFADHRSNLQVQGAGRVMKILADDRDGSRHQRFILELDSGRTVLVAHNIDLAGRVDGLGVGDRVEFSGEYEWNPQGGVLHWTHHDPQGRHPSGWLRHDGRTYE
jgi:hypothetical protein